MNLATIIQWDINKPFDEASEHYVYTIDNEYEAITLIEIRSETAQDETMKKVVKAIENQTWGPNLAHYQAFSKDLGIIRTLFVLTCHIFTYLYFFFLAFKFSLFYYSLVSRAVSLANYYHTLIRFYVL